MASSRLLLGASVIVAAVLALSGCSGGGGQDPNSSGDGASSTVTIATRNIAASLDPAAMSDDPSYSYVSAVYDPLLTYNAETREFDPALALEWEANTDSTSFTFTLRTDAVFHDGSTLTAEGVKAAIQRTIDIGKGYSYLLSGVTGISAEGDDKVTIELGAPDAAFLSKMTVIFIPSGEAVAAHPGTVGEEWFGSNDAGSGPYILDSYTPNNEIKLSQFADYWRGWDGDHVGAYNLKVTDAATQVLQLKQGTADVADSVSETDLQGLEDAGFNVVKNAGLPFYIAMNMDSPRLQDVNVRKAIALAVPYEQIINKVMRGNALPLAGPAPDWAAGHDDSLAPTETDVETAKDLMKAAGYDKSNPLKLSLIYFNGLPVEQTIATVVQAALEEIGVQLEVTGAPWATLTAQVENKDTRPDLGEVAMSQPTPDIGPLLTGTFDPRSEGGWTYWGYKDEKTVDLLRRATSATDADEQVALFEQVQQELVDQYAAIWLMQYPSVSVASPSMKNLVMSPSNRAFDYWQAYKK
jgi:peptide/nickel transport system substrate-binding protein